MGFRHDNGKWHTIAVAWNKTDKNGNEFLTVVLNENLREGEKLFFKKNEKRPGKSDPDYVYYCKSGCYDPKEMEILAEPRNKKDFNDDVPF